jgi:hypothetical protein
VNILLVLIGGGSLVFFFVRDLFGGTLTLARALPMMILMLVLIWHKKINARLTSYAQKLDAKAAGMDDAGAEAVSKTEQMAHGRGGKQLATGKLLLSSSLSGQPRVLVIDSIDIEFNVSVEAHRHELTQSLVKCGALEKRVRDLNEQHFVKGSKQKSGLVIFVPLLKIPAKLIGEIAERPLEDMNISVSLAIRRSSMPIYKCFGNIPKIEKALNKWVENLPLGWQDVMQERGVFVEGTFFTEDVMLNFLSGNAAKDLTVEVISRELLRREIRQKLSDMKAYIEGQSAVGHDPA